MRRKPVRARTLVNENVSRFDVSSLGRGTEAAPVVSSDLQWRHQDLSPVSPRLTVATNSKQQEQSEQVVKRKTRQSERGIRLAVGVQARGVFAMVLCENMSVVL